MLTAKSDQDIYNLKTYYYHLPEELIAQYPVEPRDEARLLVLNKDNGDMKDKVFKDVLHYMNEGDTLVLNETRVMPARLLGRKESGARAEIFLLQNCEDVWEALVKPAKRLKSGSKVIMDGDNTVTAQIVEELNFAGGRLVRFHCTDINEYINQYGHMPLPPYIKREAGDIDRDQYQTVYAAKYGSVAAPTAGLHFTSDLLKRIEAKGVNIARILLHVGLGTFRPVNHTDIREHSMHSEFYSLDEKTAELLNQTRFRGKKIIAVGTTVVRTLETVYNNEHGFLPQSGETNKFIYPGYEYKAIDKLITNFHLPESSLIMLVAAFAGLDNTMQAYNYAVNNRYRFFSYGDAMLIV